MDTPLRDPTTRFSNRVADYVKARPRYPDALVDLLATEIGLTNETRLADIGSGTGISAEPFLRNGNIVFCVEPNAEMRAAAESWLSGYPGFSSVNGTAEQTSLPARSVDCAFVAQAFHWFDADRSKAEFKRVLEPNGWVVLAWNTRRTSGTPFLEGYEALLRQFGTDYEQVQRRTAALANGELGRFFSNGYDRRVLDNGQDLDFDGLQSRLRSASYIPARDDSRYLPMIAALARLFHEHSRSGTVQIAYDLEVYFGRI